MVQDSGRRYMTGRAFQRRLKLRGMRAKCWTDVADFCWPSHPIHVMSYRARTRMTERAPRAEKNPLEATTAARVKVKAEATTLEERRRRRKKRR